MPFLFVDLISLFMIGRQFTTGKIIIFSLSCICQIDHHIAYALSVLHIYTVVLHEMGHCLGIGTLWSYNGCICGCVVSSGIPNYYLCANAQKQFNNIGCTGQLPIETLAGKVWGRRRLCSQHMTPDLIGSIYVNYIYTGQGSSCGHWAESRLTTELMTPVGSCRGEATHMYVPSLVDDKHSLFMRPPLPRPPLPRNTQKQISISTRSIICPSLPLEVWKISWVLTV